MRPRVAARLLAHTAVNAPLAAPSAGARRTPGGRAGRHNNRRTNVRGVAAPTTVDPLDLDTPHGPARAHVTAAAEKPRLALVLGHGAGGGVQAPDLLAAREAALGVGASVVLVEQPYRVAGRRSAAPAPQLDAAWTAVVEQLRAGALNGLPIVAGGRSSGARVACRTAAATGAMGVVCLAFPLVTPQRRDATGPPKTRQDELDDVTVPVLVVQGENDRFGMPTAGPRREVVRLRGDHRLASDIPGVRAAVGAWLAALAP
jgi:predicted alpha/beta-hydrolase family hydrolase